MSIENPTPNSQEIWPSTLTRATVEAGESGLTGLFNRVPEGMRKEVADALVDFMHELGGDWQPGRGNAMTEEQTRALIEKLGNIRP